MKIELPNLPVQEILGWSPASESWSGFTEAQMLAFRAEGIRIALEAAAKACREEAAHHRRMRMPDHAFIADDCALAVRALMEDKP